MRAIVAAGRADEAQVSSADKLEGKMTKYLTGALAAMLWLGGVNAGHALVRIADDRGGQVRRYVDRYETTGLWTAYHHRWTLRFGLHNRPWHDSSS